MNHWQMIAIAYSLTFMALALEVALLFRRRRAAVRQAQTWLDADDLQASGTGAGAAVDSGPGFVSDRPGADGAAS